MHKVRIGLLDFYFEEAAKAANVVQLMASAVQVEAQSVDWDTGVVTLTTARRAKVELELNVVVKFVLAAEPLKSESKLHGLQEDDDIPF